MFADLLDDVELEANHRRRAQRAHQDVSTNNAPCNNVLYDNDIEEAPDGRISPYWLSDWE